MIDLKKNKGNYLTYDEYRITLDRLRMDRMCIHMDQNQSVQEDICVIVERTGCAFPIVIFT